MKNRKFNYLKTIFLLGIITLLIVSCERELSDETELANYPAIADVYIDGFSAGLDYYPYDGSKATAFSVDEDTKYQGTSSMRFDVPSEGDTEGSYAGASFIIGDVDANTGGRDLTSFDALTFYAKASQAATLDNVGFGQDYHANAFQVTLQNVPITTNWVKYIIPIPDASRLIEEKGMFWYSEGPEDGAGYSFWIDELKFETLGNIAQPRPAILNGEDVVQQGLVGSTSEITGLTQTFNLGTGDNTTVIAAPNYYVFTSSDVDIIRANEQGIVSIVGDGTAVITATLGSVSASGSLTIEADGSFEFAPTPTRNPNNVISVFSNAYTNVPVDFYNGYWEPWQTTLSSDFTLNGDDILNYTNFNFVGTQFANPTIDATNMTNLHINMFIPGSIPNDLDFLITIRDFGADQTDGGTDDTFQQVFFNTSDFESNTWSTLEIPITLANKNNLGLIIYENINGSSLANFYIDNIYFYN